MQTVHPKKTPRFPKIVQIQAVEWEGNPSIVALFDDGQMMHGHFTGSGRMDWDDINAPSPKAL